MKLNYKLHTNRAKYGWLADRCREAEDTYNKHNAARNAAATVAGAYWSSLVDSFTFNGTDEATDREIERELKKLIRSGHADADDALREWGATAAALRDADKNIRRSVDSMYMLFDPDDPDEFLTTPSYGYKNDTGSTQGSIISGKDAAWGARSYSRPNERITLSENDRIAFLDKLARSYAAFYGTTRREAEETLLGKDA